MASTRSSAKARGFAVAGLLAAVVGGVVVSRTTSTSTAGGPSDAGVAAAPLAPLAAAPDAAPADAGFDAAPLGTAVLTGIVRDSAGAPLAGVRVIASRGDDAVRATSARDGGFILRGLPDEELGLDAHAPGFLPPPRRRVRPGVPVEIVLDRGHVLEGRIVDLAGAPVAGVELELGGESGGRRLTINAAERARRRVFAEGTQAAHPSMRFLKVGQLGVVVGKVPYPPPSPVAPTRVDPATTPVAANDLVTDSDGRFRVVAVPAGRFVLRARHPDFADAELGPVDVPAAAPLRLALARGATVSGVVTDPAGAPIFGATVVSREAGRTRQVTFSGKDGRFQLVHVVNHVTLTAGARGFTSAARELDAVEGGRHEEPFTLAPSGTLEPSPDEPGAEASAAGALRADVRDGQTLGPLLAFTLRGRGPGGASFHKSGEKGELAVAPLAAGAWRLTVEAQGYASTATEVEVLPGEPTPLRLELTQGATIAGTVYDREGSPLAGAEVICGLVRGKTNGFGNFRLAGVEIGEVTVEARHPQAGRGAISVPLRNGDEALTLQIRLE